MIGAVIYYGKNTLVAELPMGTMDLQMKLSSIGVGEPADRIPLKDDEERQLQVKLYASSPEEAHLLSLLTPDRSLADANTCADLLWQAEQRALPQPKCGLLADSYFEENGTAYIVMELLEGETLVEHMKKCGGKVDIDFAFSVANGVGNALANHERRPWNVLGYRETVWHGGRVWVQDQYPNLLFARDGEIFALNGLNYIAIGGAYSVDKFYRLARGYGWWEDEQPTAEIKSYVEQQLRDHPIDVMVCAVRYALGRQSYMPGIVIGFIMPLIPFLSDKAIGCMERDVRDPMTYGCGSYGDEKIDKPGWLRFLATLEEERKKRGLRPW